MKVRYLKSGVTMKIKLVPIRLTREKYRLIQHRLVDEDLSFQGLVEHLLDDHFLKPQRLTREGARNKKRAHILETV